MAKNKLLIAMLSKQMKEKRLVAAICAAPVFVLANNNLLENVERAICHPSVMSKIKISKDKFVTNPTDNDQVVYSNKCLTSLGPGTSIEFTLRLVELMYDKQTAKEIADGLIYKL